ncbi:hypothetical protein GCM10027091_40010 [Streptomyces daliensis]
MGTAGKEFPPGKALTGRRIVLARIVVPAQIPGPARTAKVPRGPRRPTAGVGRVTGARVTHMTQAT